MVKCPFLLINCLFPIWFEIYIPRSLYSNVQCKPVFVHVSFLRERFSTKVAGERFVTRMNTQMGIEICPLSKSAKKIEFSLIHSSLFFFFFFLSCAKIHLWAKILETTLIEYYRVGFLQSHRPPKTLGCDVILYALGKSTSEYKAIVRERALCWYKRENWEGKNVTIWVNKEY